MAVDFDAVRATVADEGIILREVAIIYEGLTDEELRMMRDLDLFGVDLSRDRGPGAILGKFTLDGQALFPHKAVGVHYLAG